MVVRRGSVGKVEVFVNVEERKRIMKRKLDGRGDKQTMVLISVFPLFQSPARLATRLILSIQSRSLSREHSTQRLKPSWPLQE